MTKFEVGDKVWSTEKSRILTIAGRVYDYDLGRIIYLFEESDAPSMAIVYRVDKKFKKLEN